MSLPLAEVREADRFGERAVALAQALRAGLPVPDGVAIDAESLAAVAAGTPASVPLGGALVVRASPLGEDSRAAREPRAIINVIGDAGVAQALRAVASSADRPSARAHRERNALARTPLAAIVQRLVPADLSGRLCTVDPVTGEQVRVIDAVLGLGEITGLGLVTPDRYRIARGGQLLGMTAGRLDTLIAADPGGGTVQQDVVHAGPCLGDGALVALDALARSCESVFRGPLELEWAFSGGMSWLLDVRPIRSQFLPR